MRAGQTTPVTWRVPVVTVLLHLLLLLPHSPMTSATAIDYQCFTIQTDTDSLICQSKNNSSAFTSAEALSICKAHQKHEGCSSDTGTTSSKRMIKVANEAMSQLAVQSAWLVSISQRFVSLEGEAALQPTAVLCHCASPWEWGLELAMGFEYEYAYLLLQASAALDNLDNWKAIEEEQCLNNTNGLMTFYTLEDRNNAMLAITRWLDKLDDNLTITPWPCDDDDDDGAIYALQNSENNATMKRIFLCAKEQTKYIAPKNLILVASTLLLQNRLKYCRDRFGTELVLPSYRLQQNSHVFGCRAPAPESDKERIREHNGKGHLKGWPGHATDQYFGLVADVVFTLVLAWAFYHGHGRAERRRERKETDKTRSQTADDRMLAHKLHVEEHREWEKAGSPPLPPPQIPRTHNGRTMSQIKLMDGDEAEEKKAADVKIVVGSPAAATLEQGSVTPGGPTTTPGRPSPVVQLAKAGPSSDGFLASDDDEEQVVFASSGREIEAGDELLGDVMVRGTVSDIVLPTSLDIGGSATTFRALSSNSFVSHYQ